MWFAAAWSMSGEETQALHFSGMTSSPSLAWFSGFGSAIQCAMRCASSHSLGLTVTLHACLRQFVSIYSLYIRKGEAECRDSETPSPTCSAM